MLPTPTSFRPESLVGTTLDGRYRLVAHIASGGMGAIFRAHHVYMRNELALKVLRPDLSTLPDIAERFRREAEIAASLEHDNIVRVTDFGRSSEGWLFLAMELLEGESLFDRLLRGPLSPQEAIHILVQICRGLEAAHARGVVHRDLKPENIFITARPPGGVKLLDFGIAKLTDPAAANETLAGVVVGTPEYLSPEQAAGGAVDGRADVYAAGLIGWRMLAGHHPFQTSDARSLMMMQATRPVPPLTRSRPDLEAWPGLLAAIGRACAKEVGERHASAGELCSEFEGCLASLEALPAAPSTGISAPTSRRATFPRPPAAPFQATLELDPAPAFSGRETLEGAGKAHARAGTLGLVRKHAVLFSLVLAAALLALSGVVVARWLDERPAAQAQRLLAAGRPEAARDLIGPAVLRRPTSARLHVLHGHALHAIRGQTAAGVEAYAAALDLDPRALDGAAFSDLAADLSQDRKLAERSARLLTHAGARAVPAVLTVARTGTGLARLRALDLVRDLGAEEQIDRIAAYGELLEDRDCEVRRASADRLGQLGNRAALPRLTELAREKRKIDGLFSRPQQVPACGAAEAEAAIERIEKP